MSEALAPLALSCTAGGLEKGTIALFQAMQLNEAWYGSEEEEASELSTIGSSHGCLDEEEEAGGPTETKARTSVGLAPESFPLMALPFELRLQVYHWVHLSQPIVPGRITPWYPTPIYSPYVSRRVRGRSTTEDGNRDTPGVPPAGKPRQHEPGLLSSSRPCGGIPTALLRANRQLYHEMREIPFAANEFEFVNWFASGLWAARSFVRPLQPWQQDAMRYVRLDILAKDLSGAYAAEWMELCGLWAKGLQGLRLRIAGCGPFGAWVSDELPQGEAAAAMKTTEGGRGLPRQWLEAGLDQLAVLRHLEVELAIPEWDSEGKLAWCHGLEEAIGGKRSETQPHLKITCVEKC